MRSSVILPERRLFWPSWASFSLGASVLVCCHAYNVRATKADLLRLPPSLLLRSVSLSTPPRTQRAPAPQLLHILPASLNPNPVAHEIAICPS